VTLEEDRLAQLLGSGGPEATADGLRAVVARRAAKRQRRQRAAGAGALVVLVVVAGVVVLGHGAPPTEQSATAPNGALVWRPPTPSGGAGAANAARSAAPSAAIACTEATKCTAFVPVRPLFSRSVGAVEVVATLIAVPGGAPVPTPEGTAAPENTAAGESPNFTCATAAELSVAASSGPTSRTTLVLPSVVGSTAAIEAVASVTVATPTGNAIAVAVRTSPAVARTAARFSDGRRDEMTTVDGWSVLVDPAATPGATAGLGTVAAVGPGGETLAAAPILRSPGIALPQFCVREGPVVTPAPTPRATG